MVYARRTTVSYTEGSLEYVSGLLEADRVLGGQGSLQIRVVPNDWQTAVWVGSPLAQDDADFPHAHVIRTSSPVDFSGLARGSYHDCYARFADTPEHPITVLGRIMVTS